MTPQDWALIAAAFLGSNVIVAFLTGMFTTRKVKADARQAEALADKTDAETTHLHLKTKLELDSAQLEHITGFSETVENLLRRATQQSEEIERLQSSLSRALHRLEEAQLEKEKLQAIIEYQRTENDNLRTTIVRMAKNEDALRKEVDDLTSRVDELKSQLDCALQTPSGVNQL